MVETRDEELGNRGVELASQRMGTRDAGSEVVTFPEPRACQQTAMHDTLNRVCEFRKRRSI